MRALRVVVGFMYYIMDGLYLFMCTKDEFKAFTVLVQVTNFKLNIHMGLKSQSRIRKPKKRL